MAVKKTAGRRTKKPVAPSRLELSLHAPGMGLMHRAGLGGLASTLRHIESAWRNGTLTCNGKAARDADLPGGPWANDEPPWTIEPHRISLDFGEPTNAATFFEQLFALAFQIENGLIVLPGQYHHGTRPSRAILADLQQGLLLTFLQHGKSRGLAAQQQTVEIEVDDTTLSISYRPCEWFSHQTGWRDLCNETTGELANQPIDVAGPLNPGAVVRHVAHNTATKIAEPVETMLPLVFAVVGTLALPVNRGVGVLIVPEVDDLVRFARIRPAMTPDTPLRSRVASASDAALQVQIRLRADEIAGVYALPACHGMTMRPTPWAKQQKSRVATTNAPPGDNQRLDLFERALRHLPSKIHVTTKTETTGRGSNKQTIQTQQVFRVDSLVRPMIADNLAAVPMRRWYSGFAELMRRTDANGRPLHRLVLFERKGLHAMVNENVFQSETGEAVVVRAVHAAIRARYRQIAQETEGNEYARRKRWQNEYDRWRLAFTGAKTSDRFRNALCDLFARAGINRVLQTEWQHVLPMLDDHRWALARDLALLGLASYSGSGARETTDDESSTELDQVDAIDD